MTQEEIVAAADQVADEADQQLASLEEDWRTRQQLRSHQEGPLLVLGRRPRVAYKPSPTGPTIDVADMAVRLVLRVCMDQIVALRDIALVRATDGSADFLGRFQAAERRVRLAYHAALLLPFRSAPQG